MRAFVTGSRGFVGKWLVEHLIDEGDEVVLSDPDLDVANGPGMAAAVKAAAPEVVYHLAGFSHVGASWDTAIETYRVNVLGTASVIEASLACEPSPAVLLVSSAEVYGQVDAADLPIGEGTPLSPVSPYAASKAAAELVGSQAHRARRLRVLTVRPFNHVGPGQSADFVVSALAKRIVQAQRAGASAIPVGNLSARRDFTDVRDVVRAYRMLALVGDGGQVYNVCSGVDVSVESVARSLLEVARADLRLEIDPGLFRPVDVPVLRGDACRLTECTGWRPAIPLVETLASVIEHWRSDGA